MLVPYGGATLSNSGKISLILKIKLSIKNKYILMPDITWKVIKNYENYSVSSDGNIKNNTTNRILKNGH